MHCSAMCPVPITTAIGTNAMQFSNNNSSSFMNFNTAVGYEAFTGALSIRVQTLAIIIRHLDIIPCSAIHLGKII